MLSTKVARRRGWLNAIVNHAIFTTTLLKVCLPDLRTRRIGLVRIRYLFFARTGMLRQFLHVPDVLEVLDILLCLLRQVGRGQRVKAVSKVGEGVCVHYEAATEPRPLLRLSRHFVVAKQDIEAV